MKKIYQLGDMMLQYFTDPEGHVGLQIYPSECPEPASYDKKAKIDPLIQVKIAGDIYNGCYAPGNTLRGSESSMRLIYKEQYSEESCLEKKIVTVLEDFRGYQAIHTVLWKKGASFFRTYCSYENKSQESIQLELLTSFSLTGISPYLESDCSGDIMIHRLQSRWSQEGRLLSQSIEELQLESSWNLDSVRCERFGQIGSMPVNHYFPYLAVEDTKNKIFWGVQLAHPASWQMEIYRIDENIAISGGLADREFGHWMKILKPGESLTSPEAILTVVKTESIDLLSGRMTAAGEDAVNAGPECEQSLPVIFNEYCTTWGCPSHENITGILQAIQGKGFDYFVIDCGWYKTEGVPWDISMGDYIPSATLFPQGLERTTQAIRNAGMKPGIWFEIENVGKASKAYQEHAEHLLKRDGQILTTSRRRFWDMRDPWVKEYLNTRVIGTLKNYGFEYMKIDYNDTIGLGCDGAESLGEGLRQNMLGTMEFLETVKKEIPGIILENCASGGHRLEPGFMAATSMASFSDAHECVEIPIIAANLHRAILPRQSQIWAVIRETDSLKRIAYSVANTFLGRMCLSGNVINLSEEQWEIIEKGIAFYRKITPVIKEGQTFILTPQIKRIRHPEGVQVVVRIGKNNKSFILIHTFGGVLPDKVQLSLPKGTGEIVEDIYSDTPQNIKIKDGVFTYIPEENWKAVAILLKK